MKLQQIKEKRDKREKKNKKKQTNNVLVCIFAEDSRMSNC
jgi:hypothetical protein